MLKLISTKNDAFVEHIQRHSIENGKNGVWFGYPQTPEQAVAHHVAEKIKKYLRDGVMNDKEVAKELGDVLWYIANLAEDLGYDLAEIADMNLEKLADRANRNVIKGSGDNR